MYNKMLSSLKFVVQFLNKLMKLYVAGFQYKHLVSSSYNLKKKGGVLLTKRDASLKQCQIERRPMYLNGKVAWPGD